MTPTWGVQASGRPAANTPGLHTLKIANQLGTYYFRLGLCVPFPQNEHCTSGSDGLWKEEVMVEDAI